MNLKDLLKELSIGHKGLKLEHLLVSLISGQIVSTVKEEETRQTRDKDYYRISRFCLVQQCV